MARQPKLFMWAGGKGKMIPHYAALLPEKLPEGGYAEPFAGGAALFAELRRTRGAFHAHLGDVNAEIISLYREVRDAPDRLIDNLRPYSRAWGIASPAERRALYYRTRQAYWNMGDTPEAVATLYGLMRTGFNGIWQTCKDSRGKFGTPVGLVDKCGHVLDEKVIREWSGYLQDTVTQALPYQQQDIPDNSFVFCDPPYRDSFTTYGTGFNDAAQLELIEWCRGLARDKGCTVWLANRDAGDGFFEEAAPDAPIMRFPITYTAGRRKRTDEGFEAKPATELLLVWNGEKM